MRDVILASALVQAKVVTERTRAYSQEAVLGAAIAMVGTALTDPQADFETLGIAHNVLVQPLVFSRDGSEYLGRCHTFGELLELLASQEGVMYGAYGTLAALVGKEARSRPISEFVSPRVLEALRPPPENKARGAGTNKSSIQLVPTIN